MRRNSDEPLDAENVRAVGPGLTRRAWLALSGSSVLAFQARGALEPGIEAMPSAAEGDGPGSLIVRSRRPLDLETPVTALGSWLTPNDQFFVRSHFGNPLVGQQAWRVEVGGLVERSLDLVLDDLKGFEQVTIPAVLQCSGNGRAFYRPRIPGLPWERGAVGHAEWSGVRLADVLAKAKIRDGAAHVHILGADGPPSPKTPPFLRSIPIARALDPSTLVATAMNGEPLPLLHGGPVRLVVPGWAANHWLKWLRAITLAAEEAPGFYMQTGYRIPKKPSPPDAVLKPADLVPVTTLNVKSLITRPATGTKVPPGRLEVGGVAWTGEGHVTRVELSTDRQPRWLEATLIDPPRAGSWRRWKYVWEEMTQGPVVVRARATDSSGVTQPESSPWNKSGYLWNGIDQVSCEVL